MAIKWKKSKIYGPRKPGTLRKWWWYWKKKLFTPTGLYIISVLCLTLFFSCVVELTASGYVSPVGIYITGLLNIALWIYLYRKIDKDTSSPFFMNWLKNLDCDLLILLYFVLFCAAVFVVSITYYEMHVPIYDWEGDYIGSYLNRTDFLTVLFPMIIVNNAFFMVIIRHLKDPELRKATFCKKTYFRLKKWIHEKNQAYQKKYPFEKKVQMEAVAISVLLGVMGFLSLLAVGAWGFSRLFFCMLILIGAAVVIIYIQYHKRFLSDVGILVEEIHEVSAGNPLENSGVPEDSMIREAGEDLTHVFENLSDSVKRQVKSEKMKIDLITNVSHDLKTPLTSIIGYIDLLKKTELSDEARDYVDVLSKKAERLKNMIQDVFEISKATSGNMDIHLETMDIRTLMLQMMGDMEDRIESSHRIIKKTLSAEPLYVISDGSKLYRVYQNLIENALKYSLEGSRIFIDAYAEGDMVTTVVKNTSSYEMNFTEDSITERFARGDVNRTTEGHGLGLAIVKSFVGACGGTFHIEIDGDLFKAIVQFPKCAPPEKSDEEDAIPVSGRGVDLKSDIFEKGEDVTEKLPDISGYISQEPTESA